jgi:hypothetical protein
MSSIARPIRILALALALALAAAVLARAATPAGDPDRAAVTEQLRRAGLLADPFETGPSPATFASSRVRVEARCGEPAFVMEFGGRDGEARPRSATVTITRDATGWVEILAPRPDGRQQLVRKPLVETWVQQVTLVRAPAPDAANGAEWRIVSLSALVGSTPGATAALPIVTLDTHAVSGGFLSPLSDVTELAVYPQTCAVTPPGDSVRVLVGGFDRDAAVCVFAGGRSAPARWSDGGHAEAMVRLDGDGLSRIGVTVWSGRTLTDPAAPVDARTWLMPILVGAAPKPAQEWFALR